MSGTGTTTRQHAADQHGTAAGAAAAGGPDAASARITAAARRITAAGPGPVRAGRDPVNLPMIRNWQEALGDANPVYEQAGLAPPAMAQVWTMPGLRGARDPDDPLQAMSQALDAAGFTSVVATNCAQTYHRYLRLGEQVEVRARLTEVVGPKRTALGEGWFVTTESTWTVDGEPVATMLFRVLKFRPPAAAPSGPPAAAPSPASAPATGTPAADAAPAGRAGAGVLRPMVNDDTAFFWAGAAAGELRVQRCAECGRLRHPPGPACPACGATRMTYLVAAGVGEVYSYVVHHHPPVPGRTLPIIIALVELPEGVRVMAELVGAAPDQVRIGAPVRVDFHHVDDTLTLPVWRLAPPEAPPEAAGPGTALPELRIEASPTFVVSAALATRDFQDVHHDRDLAVRRGSKDIFVNILTSTGLVQRFVTDWAGPRAVVRSVAIRLGVPCYAYDTLTLSGRVTGRTGDECVVDVVGRNSLGDHVTGTVRVALPGGGA